MMARLFPFLLSLLLFSCQESQETKISRLVKEWEGKEILFPEECSFSIHGKEECASPALDSPYKIVYYVDSLGCMSCKLKLEEWKSFMQEVDSLASDKVSSFFYFHPKAKDLKELGLILKSRGFDYPVCVDKADRFNASNLLPVNDSFHVFLLDQHNRIRVIGNPILSPSIKELYLQVITGQTKGSTEVEMTEVSLDEDLLELGTLELGESVKRTVKIRNTGNNELIITDVITSCDCVKANVSASAVQAGEDAEIRIEFKPEEKGEFFRDVYIYCNTQNSPIGIQIHGYIN